MSNEEEMMIEAYWLNIGSLILGLIAWGMPIIDMMQYKNRNFKRTGTFSIVSLSACLCFIMHANFLYRSFS